MLIYLYLPSMPTMPDSRTKPISALCTAFAPFAPLPPLSWFLLFLTFRSMARHRLADTINTPLQSIEQNLYVYNFFMHYINYFKYITYLLIYSLVIRIFFTQTHNTIEIETIIFIIFLFL